MTTPPTRPDQLTILPSYPNYGIDQYDHVYRITPAKRGRTAGQAYLRIAPVIHPRGHQWYVQLTGPDRIRRRVSMRDVKIDAFGQETTS